MRRAILAAGVVLALAATSLTGCDWGAKCEASGTETGGSGTCVVTTPGPTASPTASPSPTAGPSTTPSPSPTPTPSPAPGGFPTASSTGVPAGTTLAAAGSCSVAAGQTVTGRRFDCEQVTMGAGSTLRDSEVHGRVGGTAGFTLERVSVLSDVACDGQAAVGWGRFTARQVELVGWGDGFRVEDGLGDVLVEDSYMKLCETSSTHGDGLQGFHGGDDVVLRHNTIDQPSGNALDGVTAPIFWADGSGDRLRVEDNLLMGGGFTIRIHAGAGHTVTGNRIVDGAWRTTPWTGGPADCAGVGAMTWSDNRLVTLGANYTVASTGAVVPCG